MKPILFLAFANDDSRHLKYLKEESRRIKNSLSTLTDEVDLEREESAETRDIFQTFLEMGNRIIIFHYAGHAHQRELSLEDAVVRGESLVDILETQAANQLRLVFLNGCATYSLVEKFLGVGVGAVIGTVSPVGDIQAMQFSDAFYEAMVHGSSLQEAFRSAAALVNADAAQIPRKIRIYRGLGLQNDEDTARLPWGLYVQKNQPEMLDWKLADAIENPFIGLPPIAASIRLPQVPFKGLHWFTREDAKVFFGRGREINTLYQHVAGAGGDSILLLYGQSGVGKSSLLHAGLFPRLEQKWDIHYVRTGHTDTLRELASLSNPQGRTLFLFDQLEELISLHPTQSTTQAEAFVADLPEYRKDTGSYLTKIVLSFRKEYLAEFEAILLNHGKNYTKIFLEPIQRQGIIEVVNGLTYTSELQRKYGLAIESGLPEQIAHEILQDTDSNRAPALQILLSKMWEHTTAANYSNPVFTREQFTRLNREGLLLKDHLDLVIEKLGQSASGKWAASGLVLDVLQYFTTPHGTAAERTKSDFASRYAHIRQRRKLLKYCQDNFLITENSADNTEEIRYRLAHDAIAPLVRERFDHSNADGQKALRILKNKLSDPLTSVGKGPVLEKVDYDQAMRGRAGMRNLNSCELELLERSKKKIKTAERLKKTMIGAFLLFFAIIALLGWNFKQERNVSRRQIKISEARRLGTLAIQLAQERKHSPALSLVQQAYDNGLHPPLPIAYKAFVETASSTENDQIWTPSAKLEHGEKQLESAVFSRDGQKIITVCEDSTAVVWDVEGNPMVFLPKHPGAVVSAAFAPDGGRIVTASEDGGVRIWDLQGRLLKALPGHTYPVNLAFFSDDGRNILAASTDGVVRIWDSAGNLLLLLDRHDGEVLSAAVSPDGQKIVTASTDCTARLWDSTGNLLANLDKHTNAVASVAFSRDGSRIFTTSWDGTAKVWDLAGNLQIDSARFPHGISVHDASFSPDGEKIIALDKENNVYIWDLTGKLLNKIECEVEPGDEMVGSTFILDGQMIVSHHWSGRFMMWNLKGNLLADMRKYNVPMRDLVLSPNGKKIVSVPRHLRPPIVWTLCPTLLSSLDFASKEVNGALAAFSPDGLRVLTAVDSTVKMWDIAGSLLMELEKQPDRVSFLSYSTDGQYIETILADGTERSWDTEGGLVPDRHIRTDRIKPDTITFKHKKLTGDGRYLYTTTEVVYPLIIKDFWFEVVKIWDKDGSLYTELYLPKPAPGGPEYPGPQVSAVAVSADGRMIATGSYNNRFNSRIKFWNKRGKLLSTMDHSSNIIRSIAFSPDGKWIITAGGTAKLWTAKGELVADLDKHKSGVYSAQFSPDGQRIITLSYDNTARIWPTVDALTKWFQKNVRVELTESEKQFYEIR